MYPAPNHYPIQHNLDNDTIFSMTHVTPGADSFPPQQNQPPSPVLQQLRAAYPVSASRSLPAADGADGAQTTYVAMDGHPDTYMCYNNEQAMKREMHLLSLFKKFVEIQNSASPHYSPARHADGSGTAFPSQPTTPSPLLPPNPASKVSAILLGAHEGESASHQRSPASSQNATALLYVALGVICAMLLVLIVLFAALVRMNRRIHGVGNAPRSFRNSGRKKKKVAAGAAGAAANKEERWLEIMKKSVRR